MSLLFAPSLLVGSFFFHRFCLAPACDCTNFVPSANDDQVCSICQHGTAQHRAQMQGNVCSTCTFSNPEDAHNCQLCGQLLVSQDEGPSPISSPSLQSEDSRGDADPGITWICPACTVENPDTTRFCDVCAAPRPLVIPPVPPLPVVSPVAADSRLLFFLVSEEERCRNGIRPFILDIVFCFSFCSGEWICPICTLKNLSEAENCDACGASRP